MNATAQLMEKHHTVIENISASLGNQNVDMNMAIAAIRNNTTEALDGLASIEIKGTRCS